MQIDPTQSSSLHAVSGLTPTSMESPPPTAFLGGTIDGIAGQLGMTTAQLKAGLAGGTSLADIAQSRGVDRASLVASIEGQVKANRQSAGLQAIDAEQLDRAVTRAVDRGSQPAPPAATDVGTPSGPSFSSVFDQLA
jgi:surface antigen